MASSRVRVMFLGAALASCANTTADRPRQGTPTSHVRASAVPPACRGKELKVDPELESCACDEREIRQRPDGGWTERAGAWCGPRRPEETTEVTVDVEAERPVIAAGEPTQVVVRIANPTDRAAIVRFPSRHLRARLARPGGEPLEGEAFSSGDYKDEALIELEAHGSVAIVVPVAGTYPRHGGTGEASSIEAARPSAGKYAVRVFLNGVAGVDARLVPIELR